MCCNCFLSLSFVIVYNLAKQKFYIFIYSHLFIFFIWLQASPSYIIQNLNPTKSMFSSNIFMVSIFILKSLIDLDYFADRIPL